jgi:hypothetical protein
MSFQPDDRTDYVMQMARELGILLRPEDVPRVAGTLAHMARAAAQLREAGLDQDTLPAPVFRPGAGGEA